MKQNKRKVKTFFTSQGNFFYKLQRSLRSVRNATGVFVVLLVFFLLPGADEAWAGYEPNPQTAFSEAFVQAAEGEQWFLDEIERLLNIEHSG